MTNHTAPLGAEPPLSLNPINTPAADSRHHHLVVSRNPIVLLSQEKPSSGFPRIHLVGRSSVNLELKTFFCKHSAVFFICLYTPVHNSNKKRSVPSGSRAVDFSAESQDVLDALRIAAGHRVVEEALFTRELSAYVVSLHRMSETSKFLLVQQRENAVASRTLI